MAEIFEVPQNMTRVIELLPFASGITGNVLGVMILLLVGATAWMVTSSFNPKQSLLTTGYLITIAAIFLWILELLAVEFVWSCVVILVVGMVFSAIKGGGATA